MVRPLTLAIVGYMLLALSASTLGTTVQGRSPWPAPSAAEAIELARQDAVEQLLPMAEARIAALGSAASPQELRRHVEAYAASFVGQATPLEKPYGTVWTGVMPVQINRDFDRIAHRVRSDRADSLAISVGGFLLSMVIIGFLGLLHLIIGKLTRGYYRWRLRAFTLATMILSVGSVQAVCELLRPADRPVVIAATR
jgi:hypothetical protein